LTDLWSFAFDLKASCVAAAIAANLRVADASGVQNITSGKAPDNASDYPLLNNCVSMMIECRPRSMLAGG
jgi:hypothetical protein